MTAIADHATPTILTARLDGEGRLVEADPALAALNGRAGGAVGAPLALPTLATVVRLTRRLGIVVSRAVTVADDEVDIEFWARAQPEDDGVRLAVSGWRELPGWRPPRGPDPIVVRMADAEWRWQTDAALRLTLVTPSAGRMHGFDAFALLGRPLTELFDFPGQDGLMPILTGLAGRTAIADQPVRLHGSGRSVVISAAMRFDGSGGFAGLVGAARMAVEPADAAAAMLPTGLTTGLDRALRSPLARIVANADSIHAQADGPITPDYADYAADIAHAGRHLLALIDDLTDLEAVDRPDFRLALEPIDLADVARRAAGLLGVKAANVQVLIDRPAPAASMLATGEFRRALQILVNLIGNALRYSPAGGVVTVTAERDGATARAIVSDQGKGIDPADQARIFAKFERVDPSEVGGNGLGLYIARRLARAMGGDLTVESAPGEGARFTLTLAAR